MNAALLLALAVLAMAAHSALAIGEIVTLLPLDETSGSKARDIGSADNDATYVNGPLLGQPGFQSPFLSVKLSPDYRQYISVPHDSAYESLTDACVLLWVKPRALWSGYSGLFSKGDNLVVYLDRSGYVVARFTAGGSSVTLVSADPISLGSWHAVQVCWGSSGAELYVDSNSNVVRNTRFTGSPFSGNRNAPAVGALCWSSRSAGFSSGEVNSFLNGWVEAFTIYNRQITLSRLSGWVLQALSPTTTTSTTKTTTTSTKTTTTSTTTTKTTTTSTTTTGPSTTSTTKTTTTSTTTTSTTTTSTTTTTTAFSTASASIIALLPLNDTTGSTAFDVIGDHDGTYQNSPAFGKDGPFSGTSAVRLNPKDRTYVSLPDSTDFRLTEACILLWFYPRSSGSPFGLIGKGDNLVVQLKRDGCLLVRLRDRSVSGRTETTMVSPAPLAVNRWYEVVVCFGPAGATLFINGARVASSSFAGSPLWGNSAPFVLGAINNADGALSRRTLSDGAHDTFNGRLFGFLIYGQQQTSSPVVVENALLAGLDGKFVNPTTTTTAAATTSTTAALTTSTTTTPAPTTSSTTTTSTTTTTTSTTETRPPTTTSLGNSTSSSTTTTTTTSTTTTTTTRTTTTSTTLLANSTTPAGNSTTAI